MAMSAATSALGMGLGDQLQQQTQDAIQAMRKKKKPGDLTNGSPMANGGPGSVNLSAAASMLFGGKM